MCGVPGEHNDTTSKRIGKFYFSFFNFPFPPNPPLLSSLHTVSDLYNIDPTRVAIQGFSDGATYALSLGLASGKTFTHVVAFSPGGVAPPQLSGTPQVFISAGQKDAVFPYAAMTAVACQLVSNGYPVTFEPFAGGHEVPVAVAAAAMTWITGEPTAGNMPAGACSA